MPAQLASNIKTSNPIYGANGIITGYTNAYDTGPDYPVYNAKGELISIKTGKKWTGAQPGTSSATGQPVAPKPAEFTVTRTEKNPVVTSAVDSLIGQQQQVSTDLNKTFQDYLKEARDMNDAAKSQLKTDQAAFDTTKIESQLPAINRDYEAGQNQVTEDMAQRNRDYAAETKATLERLSGENRAYETAAQAVADRAVATALKRNNIFQLGSGTPTSNSGALTNRAIQAYANINTPLQRELSGRRYDQIANIERPYERELYGQDQALLARQSSLESDFAARQADTLRYLQSLKMQVAGMSREQAQSYLRNLGLPFEIAQRVMSGEISELGALQSLDERANFYTVNTPFDASRLPPVNSFPIGATDRNYSPQVMPLPDYTERAYQPLPRSTPRLSPSVLPRPRYESSVLNYAGAYPQSIEGRGVVDLPNDFTFSRNPADQAAFLNLQRSYE